MKANNELSVEIDSLMELNEDLHDEVYSGYYSEEVDRMLCNLYDKAQLISDLVA